MVTTSKSRRNTRIREQSSIAPADSKPQNKAKLQNLFDAWADLNKRIRRAEHIVVFLDFDGTLVRLRRKPKEVFLEEPKRRILRKLLRHRNVTLCFISGRQLGDLQERVRVDGAIYFGLHGWERSNGQTPDLPGVRRLRGSMQRLQQQTQDLPGIKVEDKGVCFGVHYRRARKPAIKKAQALVLDALDRLGPDFKMMAGKKIWEIYPKGMGNKGTAAKELLEQIPGRKLVVYAGDDTTDETAFALLPKAVTIRVGKFRESKAKFFLKGPAEVLSFLEKLDEALSR
jgi:trehalose 6-phosphate phosphatase